MSSFFFANQLVNNKHKIYLFFQVFSVGQPIVFQFKSLPLALITIKDLEVTDINAIKSGKETKATKAQVITV